MKELMSKSSSPSRCLVLGFISKFAVLNETCMHSLDPGYLNLRGSCDWCAVNTLFAA